VIAKVVGRLQSLHDAEDDALTWMENTASTALAK